MQTAETGAGQFVLCTPSPLTVRAGGFHYDQCGPLSTIQAAQWMHYHQFLAQSNCGSLVGETLAGSVPVPACLCFAVETLDARGLCPPLAVWALHSPHVQRQLRSLPPLTA